jgi:Pentapeptide repeats (8 copies)
VPVRDRSDLRADCARCFALCCAAPAFTRSSEFAIDKPAGVPCPHLGGDHRCTIHDRLRPEGFAGCTAYDCFGAGQRLAQETFGGRDWREHPEVAAPMWAALPVLRGLHELIWYLLEAADRPEARAPGALRADLDAVIGEAERAASSGPSVIGTVDVDRLRARAAPLLREVSRLVRAGHPGPDHSDADLSGADLRGADLAGASLRGSLLLAADLRDADLSRADLLGADLRGARLDGARLTDALYLTRTQVGGALGDRRTTLPAALEHPAHWASSDDAR